MMLLQRKNLKKTILRHSFMYKKNALLKYTVNFYEYFVDNELKLLVKIIKAPFY